MVSPHYAVWIPSGKPHRYHATDNARLFFLFVQPGVARMLEHSCTVTISPLLRELIAHLAGQPVEYAPSGPVGHLVQVLLEQLAGAPVQQLHFALPWPQACAPWPRPFRKARGLVHAGPLGALKGHEPKREPIRIQGVVFA